MTCNNNLRLKQMMSTQNFENYKVGIPVGSHNPECVDYNTLLRITSGQESEPGFILIEHAYSRPWNWQPGLSSGRPRKTLFMHRVPKSRTPKEDEELDVVSVDQSDISIPYDLNKGKSLMNECERHVTSIQGMLNTERGRTEEEEDSCSEGEDKIDRTNWTNTQNEFYDRSIKMLDSYQLARLALKNTHNEPVKRRAILDKTASQFRRMYYDINWDSKLTLWLHGCLFQNLSKTYLACYFDVVQTLKAKIPRLVDKMIKQTTLPKGPSQEAMNLLLKRPWDPVSPSLSQCKPRKLDKMPIIIQIPAGANSPNVPQVSRRTRFFNSQLQHLAKIFTFTVQPDSKNAGVIMDRIVVEAKTRISETKAQYPNQPIVLLGWGIGAVLAGLVSLVESVSANILLGLPMESHAGCLGEANDPLLDNKTPSLFITGENTVNSTIEDLEEFRHRMKATTNLVVIADSDERLKLSQAKRYFEGLTQSMVDRCIVDEIGDFLSSILSDPEPIEPLPQAPPSNSLRLKTKDLVKRKRPTNTELTSSKVFRAGTNLSQNLGLKIPIGSSSVTPCQADKVEIDSQSGSSHLLNEFLTKPQSSGKSRVNNTQSMSTISLGSIGSLSNQKYKRMMKMSDQNTALSVPQSRDMKGESKTGVPRKNNTTKCGLSKRGRPPGKSRVGHAGANSVGGPRAARNAFKHNPTPTKETSMAVLTFTGNETDAPGLDVAGEGISSLGTGFLTLSKGGTSTVRVFSANSPKVSTLTSLTESNQPKQLFPHSEESELTQPESKLTLVSEDQQEMASDRKSKVNLQVQRHPDSTASPLALNIQGISASRNSSTTIRLSNQKEFEAPSTPTPKTIISRLFAEDSDGPLAVPAPQSFFDSIPQKEEDTTPDPIQVCLAQKHVANSMLGKASIKSPLKVLIPQILPTNAKKIMTNQGLVRGPIQILGRVANAGKYSGVCSSGTRVVPNTSKPTMEPPFKITTLSKPISTDTPKANIFTKKFTFNTNKKMVSRRFSFDSSAQPIKISTMSKVTADPLGEALSETAEALSSADTSPGTSSNIKVSFSSGSSVSTGASASSSKTAATGGSRNDNQPTTITRSTRKSRVRSRL